MAKKSTTSPNPGEGRDGGALSRPHLGKAAMPEPKRAKERIKARAKERAKPDPKLPDLVVCRPELAAAVLAVTG